MNSNKKSQRMMNYRRPQKIEPFSTMTGGAGVQDSLFSSGSSPVQLQGKGAQVPLSSNKSSNDNNSSSVSLNNSDKSKNDSSTVTNQDSDTGQVDDPQVNPLDVKLPDSVPNNNNSMPILAQNDSDKNGNVNPLNVSLPDSAPAAVVNAPPPPVVNAPPPPVVNAPPPPPVVNPPVDNPLNVPLPVSDTNNSGSMLSPILDLSDSAAPPAVDAGAEGNNEGSPDASASASAPINPMLAAALKGQKAMNAKKAGKTGSDDPEETSVNENEEQFGFEDNNNDGTPVNESSTIGQYKKLVADLNYLESELGNLLDSGKLGADAEKIRGVLDESETVPAPSINVVKDYDEEGIKKLIEMLNERKNLEKKELERHMTVYLPSEKDFIHINQLIEKCEALEENYLIKHQEVLLLGRIITAFKNEFENLYNQGVQGANDVLVERIKNIQQELDSLRVQMANPRFQQKIKQINDLLDALPQQQQEVLAQARNNLSKLSELGDKGLNIKNSGEVVGLRRALDDLITDEGEGAGAVVEGIKNTESNNTPPVMKPKKHTKKNHKNTKPKRKTSAKNNKNKKKVKLSRKRRTRKNN